MERFEFVCLNGCFILMEVRQRVLRAIVVCIIVCIDGLSFKTRNGVELLDGSRAEPRKRPEDGTLDLSNLGVLHSVDERILRLRRVILQLFRSVLFAERSNLVEVHFEIMRHLLCEVIFWCPKRGCGGGGQEQREHHRTGHCQNKRPGVLATVE